MNAEEKLLSSTNIYISIRWWVKKCCAFIPVYSEVRIIHCSPLSVIYRVNTPEREEDIYSHDASG